jgi:hypothetical protein
MLDGPNMVGDNLFVKKPHPTNDGRMEFIVQTLGGDERVRIEIISPPEGDQAFRILEVKGGVKSMDYPLQKGFKGWP